MDDHKAFPQPQPLTIWLKDPFMSRHEPMNFYAESARAYLKSYGIKWEGVELSRETRLQLMLASRAVPKDQGERMVSGYDTMNILVRAANGAMLDANDVRRIQVILQLHFCFGDQSMPGFSERVTELPAKENEVMQTTNSGNEWGAPETRPSVHGDVAVPETKPVPVEPKEDDPKPADDESE